MVAFIGYRMYYDLIHWHKLVSFLPGYRYNREFFEKMLGVAKEYRGLETDTPGLLQKYFLYLPRLLFQTVKILYSFLFMKKLIRTFNNYFDKIFSETNGIDLRALELKELQELLFSLMKKFLFPWRIPIANDFAVMVSSGITNRVFVRWMDEPNVYPYLHFEAHRALITLDPGYEMLRIAGAIRRDSIMKKLFSRDTDPAEIYRLLKKDYEDHEITLSIHTYIFRYGDRPPNELKLETETISENPGILIALLMNMTGDGQSIVPESSTRNSTTIPSFQSLGFLKRKCIRFLLQWTRNSIVRREETRFRRALIFGYARKIFMNIGRKFQASSWILDSRDIFYLKSDEIFACIQADGPSTDLRDIVEKRKKEMHQWESSDLPRRIETCETIDTLEKKFKESPKPESRPDTSPLRGMVVAKNKRSEISGIALVLKEFDSNAAFGGKILVTRQTDPGWTIVFPSLTALIVERGGMLSHAAIVARELGIPCIVGVEKAVSRIRTGDRIFLDLDKGEVHVEKDEQ